MAEKVCPGEETLRAFLEGHLDRASRTSVERHVASCQDCRSRLSRESDNADGDATVTEGASRSDEHVAVMPRYRLLERIGEGGMGVIHRARDERFGRDVAVKLLSCKGNADHLKARFERESRIAAQLQHPSVPPVYDAGVTEEGAPFIAMKLVKGSTLAHLLQHERGHQPEPGRWLAIFEQVCHAVGYAHSRGVIHRDLKPANIMVGRFGEVQVMDWGLAKTLTSSDQTQGASAAETAETAVRSVRVTSGLHDDLETSHGDVVGTFAYMSPEQAAGELDQVDARCDVFGLGAILCEILTGFPPYHKRDGSTLRLAALHGDLEDAVKRLQACEWESELVQLCLHCLAVRRDDRPATGNQVAATVAKVRATSEERAREAELARAKAEVRASEERKRRRLSLVAAVVIVGVLSLGTIGTAVGFLVARNAAESEGAAKIAAIRAKRESERRLSAIEQFNGILLGAIAQLDPRNRRNRAVRMERILASSFLRAADQLDSVRKVAPLTVAAFESRTGQLLDLWGMSADAVILLQRAREAESKLLGRRDERTLSTSTNLGW